MDKQYPKYIYQRMYTVLQLETRWWKKLSGYYRFYWFPKAFDCVSHRTLLHKLNIKFGIEGNLLSWLTDYLLHQTQITVVNSTHSEELNVTYGIPQLLVLSPCLFGLYNNDMPEALISGNFVLYAYDTTLITRAFQRKHPRYKFGFIFSFSFRVQSQNAVQLQCMRKVKAHA